MTDNTGETDNEMRRRSLRPRVMARKWGPAKKARWVEQDVVRKARV